jgi:hypothetical protein
MVAETTYLCGTMTCSDTIRLVATKITWQAVGALALFSMIFPNLIYRFLSSFEFFHRHNNNNYKDDYSPFIIHKKNNFDEFKQSYFVGLNEEEELHGFDGMMINKNLSTRRRTKNNNNNNGMMTRIF